MSEPAAVTWAAARSAVLDAAASDSQRSDVAELVATLLGHFVDAPDFPGYFRLWESAGYHVTPVHFYSPIPDTSALGLDLWERETPLLGIDLADARQLDLLAAFRRFGREYDALPSEPTSDDGAFYLNNPMFSGTDALALYCVMRHFKPSSVIEVGSGFSTRLLVQAAARNGPTRIVSIEPHPDAALRQRLLPVTLVESRVQDVPISWFESLRSGDVLFIDSSHAVRIDGDVTFLFLEIFPRLKPGVIVHVHDVFLPRELPREWVVDRLRFWGEQYLLQAFLAFNTAFEVLLANGYLGLRYENVLREVFPRSPWWRGGGSFWMRRRLSGGR
jgi:hypothetical protein